MGFKLTMWQFKGSVHFHIRCSVGGPACQHHLHSLLQLQVPIRIIVIVYRLYSSIFMGLKRVSCFTCFTHYLFMQIEILSDDEDECRDRQVIHAGRVRGGSSVSIESKAFVKFVLFMKITSIN